MVRVGVHVSIAGGIANAVDRAAMKGCDVFQIFSRNPRGWKFKDLSPQESKSFTAKLKKSVIGPVFDHMPYLPNLASPDEDIYTQTSIPDCFGISFDFDGRAFQMRSAPNTLSCNPPGKSPRLWPGGGIEEARGRDIICIFRD